MAALWLAAVLLAGSMARAEGARQADIDALIKELKRGKFQVALKGLSVIGEPAVDSLIPLLAKDDHTRRFALQILGDIGPGAHRAVPAMIEVLRENLNELGFELRYENGYATPVSTNGLAPLPNAGLRCGQLLIAVNDTSVVGMPLPKIYKLIGEQTGIFTVTVRDPQNPWFKGPVPKGKLMLGSALYDVLRVLQVDLNRPRQNPGKVQAIKALGKIGAPARAALPELEKYLLLEESTDDLFTNNFQLRGSALESISILFPASAGDVPKLTLDLKDRDRSKADLAWAKLSYFRDLPSDTLFAMREKIKRTTIVRRGLWFPLPGNFPESLARIACNHRSWAGDLMNDPDPDIASSMVKTFRRDKFPEACAKPYTRQ